MTPSGACSREGWRNSRRRLLLEHVPRRRCPRVGDVADELRLSCGEVRDPLDVAVAGTALECVRHHLECLLVARERSLAGTLAGLDDPFVQLTQTLRRCLEACVRRARAGAARLRSL